MNTIIIVLVSALLAGALGLLLWIISAYITSLRWRGQSRTIGRILSLVKDFLEPLITSASYIPLVAVILLSNFTFFNKNEKLLVIVASLGIIGAARVMFSMKEITEDEMRKPHIEQAIAWDVPLYKILWRKKFLITLFVLVIMYAIYILLLDYNMAWVLKNWAPSSKQGEPPLINLDNLFIPLTDTDKPLPLENIIPRSLNNIIPTELKTWYTVVGVIISVILAVILVSILIIISQNIYNLSQVRKDFNKLSFENVSIKIANKDKFFALLEDINIESAKRFIWLRGEPGSGKTTLAKAVSGALPPKFNIEGVIKAPSKIMIVPQEPATALPHFLPINSWRATLKLGKDEKFGRRYPHQLSAGQRRKVFLQAVKEFVEKNKNEGILIVLDEPEASLDLCGLANLKKDIIDEIKNTSNVRFLYISHRDYFAMALYESLGDDMDFWEVKNRKVVKAEPKHAKISLASKRGEGGECLYVPAGIYETEYFDVNVPKGWNLNRGSVLYVIGPNGAGKTTLLKMIKGIIDYSYRNGDSGIKRECPNVVLFLDSSERAFPPDFTVENAIELLSKTWKAKPNWEKYPEISERKHVEFQYISGGQKEKLIYGLVLDMAIERFDLILLDEPFSKLPVDKVKLIIDKILNTEGKGIAIVSHHLMAYMDWDNTDLPVAYVGEWSEIKKLKDCKVRLFKGAKRASADNT